jgi:protein phosphatase
MSPAAASKRDGVLEHPEEAFGNYRSEGVTEAVIQEKHMGSRVLIVLCRDEDAARERFGVTTGETGMIYSRSGRAFFSEPGLLEAVLSRLRESMNEARFWERHCTGWALLDAEIMPWSAKAQSLIRR